MKKKLTIVLLLAGLLLTPFDFVYSQKGDPVFEQLRREAMSGSEIMNTIHVLTDVYGPRLTGSPNLVAAGKWASEQMKAWGFDKTGLEEWDFGHPGWVNDRASGFITAPVQDSLVFEVLAWTPGTRGTVKGSVVQVVIPTKPAPTQNNPNRVINPTVEEFEAYLAGIAPQVNGKMVLVGKPASIGVNFNPPPKRLADEELRRRLNAPPNLLAPAPAPAPDAPKVMTGAEINRRLDEFLVKNKALVRINDAAMDHGLIRAFNNGTFDVSKAIPTVVMRNEDFGRIARLIKSGRTVSLEFNIANRIFPGKFDRAAKKTTFPAYNVIGEIAGTDKKDEVIMLGGHLDSWHAGTGATDNATGCAVMMEAARLLKKLGVKPRRTIRVALWAGEEQGLLGSQAYVAQHFGSFEKPLADYEKFGGYFNIDSGTGRARAMTVFGPDEAAKVLRDALAQFEDLGFMGVASTRNRRLGGSDHTSFNQAGLPGIGVQQDPIEYFTHTWHTQLDTYERVIEDDVKKSAVIIAAAVYVLAQRDELLPRFKGEQMPRLN